jgi:hypothetical protein
MPVSAPTITRGGWSRTLATIFKSMEQGRTFRISVPKYPTQDPITAFWRIRRPLHPLLLLRPASGSRADRQPRGIVLFRPCHLLPQRPFVDGTGTEEEQHRLSKGDNAFLAVDDVAASQAAGRPARPADHPQATGLLDADPRAKLLQEGTQPDEFVAVLFDHADRVRNSRRIYIVDTGLRRPR